MGNVNSPHCEYSVPASVADTINSYSFFIFHSQKLPVRVIWLHILMKISFSQQLSLYRT